MSFEKLLSKEPDRLFILATGHDPDRDPVRDPVRDPAVRDPAVRVLRTRQNPHRDASRSTSRAISFATEPAGSSCIFLSLCSAHHFSGVQKRRAVRILARRPTSEKEPHC